MGDRWTAKNQVNLTKTFLIIEEQVPSIRNFPDYLLCYSILVGLIGSKLIKSQDEKENLKLPPS